MTDTPLRRKPRSPASSRPRLSAQETLLGLGIDTTKPIETQRDFAHLRWWREIAEGVMKAAVIAMALGFGGTLATLVWLGFKISLSQ